MLFSLNDVKVCSESLSHYIRNYAQIECIVYKSMCMNGIQINPCSSRQLANSYILGAHSFCSKKWGESHIPAHVQYAMNCKGGHFRTLL